MDTTVRDQQGTLAQLRRALADLATNRRRVELQLNRLKQQADQLEATAAERVAAGDDEGARSALTRKVTMEKAIADLAERHATLQADEQKLTATADQVQTQIEDFRIRKDTLVARESAATAKTEMHRINRDQGAIAGDLDDVERHTREAEATAAAYDELADPTDAANWEKAFEAGSQPSLDEGDGRGPKSLPQ
ncbi:PspA/IM30 family protein [Aeromicrobium sp. Leaf350]|uniref:PspA/IM30 family protein n=1 Tax=Aeromicrobium sp. Leaf350 TaxID=2876565 RepID=UPI001E2D0C3D|nr:PspA/IM30 family protein [Aeromicrobium sp. Leaf350]